MSKKKPKRMFGNRPTPPPGLDKLREAWKKIKSDQVYHMQAPDGTVHVVTGEALLETAVAIVGLADVVNSDDDELVRCAFKRVVDSGEQPGAILCVKVGRSKGTLPPGYLTADCSLCGCAVWISPENHDRLALGNLKVVCSDCTGQTGG